MEHGLSWEMLPDAALGEVAVWDALLDVGVPQTALMRQLQWFTRLGSCPTLSGRTAAVTAQLADAERLRPAGSTRSTCGSPSGPTPRAGRPGAPRLGADTEGGRCTGCSVRHGVRRGGAVRHAHAAGGRRVRLDGSSHLRHADHSRKTSAALALVQLATEPHASAVGFTAGHGVRGRRDCDLRAAAHLRGSVSTTPYGWSTRCRCPGRTAPADGPRVAEAARGEYVRRLHGQRDLGRRHPIPAPGVGGLPAGMGIAAKLVVVGMTASAVLDRGPRRRRHARRRRLRRSGAVADHRVRSWDLNGQGRKGGAGGDPLTGVGLRRRSGPKSGSATSDARAARARELHRKAAEADRVAAASRAERDRYCQ